MGTRDKIPGSSMVVAVLVPCLDEETTVAGVVTGFRGELSEAPFTFMTTLRLTPLRSERRKPGRWFASNRFLVKAVWCGGCSPMSTRMST